MSHGPIDNNTILDLYGGNNTLDESILVLVGEVLKRLVLGFLDNECGTDTCSHEEGEDLKTKNR